MYCWKIAFANFVAVLAWVLIPQTQSSPIKGVHSTAETGVRSVKEVLPREFEPWLHGQHDIDTTTPFNISEFTGGVHVQPYELAHLYFEGDIKEIEGHLEKEKDGKKHVHLNTWPDGIVPYIIDKTIDKYDRGSIEDAFEEYHARTCIRFVPRKDEKLYLIIKSDNAGCWSVVGQADKPQVVNLQSDNCMDRSTIIHELMHAIGFIHEHSRPDRDKYIKLYLENLRDYQAQKHNFIIYPDLYEDLGVEYDVGSVMQYNEYSFGNGDAKTMVAKNGKKLGNDFGFAMSDITEINRLYNCKKGKKP